MENHDCPVFSFSEVGNPMCNTLMISYWCVLLSCSTVNTIKNTLSSCAVSVECMCFLCRLCLAYGGSDVTRCFFWLMQRAGFPYRDCQLSNKLDCMLLQQLKESFCHLDQVTAQHMELNKPVSLLSIFTRAARYDGLYRYSGIKCPSLEILLYCVFRSMQIYRHNMTT